jgi:primosomal protein N'
MKTEIQQKLEKLAYSRTTPFCYGCYIKAPMGVCPECHSDDLMRELVGVGVEYGVDWVIQHILETEIIPMDTDADFEESIRQCYPETIQVGWLNLDTVQVIKNRPNQLGDC